MAKFYTIKWASPASDPLPPHNNVWQTIILEGYDPKVKISVKEAHKAGDQIYGDVTKEQSKAGAEYYRFRKQQVPDGVERPQQTTLPANNSELMTLVKEIHAVVVANKAESRDVATIADRAAEETILDDIDDEPVNLDDIPF